MARFVILAAVVFSVAIFLFVSGCTSENSQIAPNTSGIDNAAKEQAAAPVAMPKENQGVQNAPSGENANKGPVKLPIVDLVPDFKKTDRICVQPVLFISADATLSDSEIASSKKLLAAHLKLAQEHYKSLLNDTFCIKNDTIVYKSKNNGNVNISDNRLLKEIIEYAHDDRYNSSTVYLELYAQPNKPAYEIEFMGGGRTFNGPPNSGGGYVEVLYSSLVSDKPYPFQSTLVHELGHAFGLTHSDCFGYDLENSDSLMSYNPNHWTSGLLRSNGTGIFMPEEYFELSLNKRVFPAFEFNDSLHNPGNKVIDMNTIQDCFLGPIGENIGKYWHVPEVGYELFFNGKHVSGPEAELYSAKQAQENCDWNIANNKNLAIECRYNGHVFYRSD